MLESCDENRAGGVLGEMHAKVISNVCHYQVAKMRLQRLNGAFFFAKAGAAYPQCLV